MASEYTSPSQKTIEFLYKGVIAFYPDVARASFLLGKAPLPYLSKWGGFERLDFLDLVLNTTKSDSIEEAASIIKNWHDGKGFDQTIPANLNELVEDLDKANQTKNEYNKQVLAKKTLFESEKIKHELKGEKPIEVRTPQQQIEIKAPEPSSNSSFVPAPDIPGKESQNKDFTKKGAELKSDPIEEINKSESITLGINVTKSEEPDPVAVQSFAPLRSNIFYATKKITKEEGGTVAAGLNLWAHGITATQLTTKIQSKFPELDPKHAKKIEDVIRVIHGLETDPIKTNLARAAFPTRDIDILLSSRSGVTQTEVAVFFNPVVPGVEGDGVVYQENASFFKNILASAGQQVFGTVAKKGVEKALGTTLSQLGKKVGTQVATKVATVVLGKAAGTTVGTAIGGPVGAAIGFVLGTAFDWVVNKLKDFASWAKRNSKELLVAGGIFLAGGLIFGNPIFVLLGGLAAYAIFAAILPLLVTFIVFVVVISLILFIINSGAYLVPPSPSSLPGAVESPYIGVEKIPSTDCMNKAGCPTFGNVTYKIKITAKKGVLTNIRIANKYSTSCKSGNKSFPAPSVPEISTPPESISPTSSYEFSYDANITSSFDDCLVIDTLEVTADTPEKPAVTAAASAAISVGNPPEECPTGWPVNGSFPLTQGPRGGFSHSSVEAIDIATYTGVNVKATHSGTAKVVYTNGAYRPAYVDIISSCRGKAFTSRYAHLSAVSVKDGQRVTMGQSIGASGSDGTGPHLHYEFKDLKMTPPYIPKTVQYGCSDNCGSIP